MTSSPLGEEASARAQEPIGVVDIGSNSVRLVVFEGLTRNPTSIFNEKAICAIGRNMVSTGRLDAEGVKMAFDALKRFRAVAQDLGVKDLDVVATAAVRDAKNGKDFVARAAEICGGPIRVLSGEEEAELAAQGVVSGIPDADGLVGDLGGGSLELIPVQNGKLAAGHTLPFGPLRLMDSSGGKIERAREIVDEGLAAVPGLERLKGRAFYAVGGIWRNIARIQMSVVDYPLHVLQQYVIPRHDALRLTQLISNQSRKSLERIADIPKRRIEALPYGAIVLERLIKAAQIDSVVISAFGVREGVLYAKLPDAIRARDPMIEACTEIASRFGRSARQGGELIAFTAPLFPDESPAERRLREATCLLGDSAWREHPDYRAELAFRYVLQAQIASLDHEGRCLMALALYYRYAGDDGEGLSLIKPVVKLAGDKIERKAFVLGLALRLAYVLAGSATGVGKEFTLELSKHDVTLGVAKRRAGVIGEPVEKRLERLAEALGRKPKIEIG